MLSSSNKQRNDSNPKNGQIFNVCSTWTEGKSTGEWVSQTTFAKTVNIFNAMHCYMCVGTLLDLLLKNRAEKSNIVYLQI